MAAPRKTYSPEALGILNDESLAGAGAATVMRTLGPAIAARLENVLRLLENAPPDLNTLLDLRAKISVIRSLERELHTQMQRGREAAAELEELYN
jgi:hypothetical protein